MLKKLEGKTALITGITQGYGKEIAFAFSNAGAKVIISDTNDVEGKLIAQQIGNDCLYIPLNVKKESDWKHAIDTRSKEFNALNILVNNAGVSKVENPFSFQPNDLPLANIRELVDINEKGIILGCQYAIGIMKKSTSGSSINISKSYNLSHDFISALSLFLMQNSIGCCCTPNNRCYNYINYIKNSP